MRRVIHCVGGVVSPLIFNVAMSALDEHLHRPWKPGGAMAAHHQRIRRRAKGLPNWRVVRYADLCRARHKSAYAEARVMPTRGGSCLAGGWFVVPGSA
jgi:RNA-directed DNA polymerase